MNEEKIVKYITEMKNTNCIIHPVSVRLLSARLFIVQSALAQKKESAS